MLPSSFQNTFDHAKPTDADDVGGDAAGRKCKGKGTAAMRTRLQVI
jgi:hypothetical protein